MLTEEQLKEVLHKRGVTRLEKILLCIALDPDKPRQLKDIRHIAMRCGLRDAQNWNIADSLAKADGKAIKTTGGWELRSEGKQIVSRIAKISPGPASTSTASALRSQLAKITDLKTQDFVSEAVVCFEYKQYRAAAVLCWVGAMSVLYTHVLSHKLSEFNAEAVRRNSKWKPASTVNDLAEMKEYDFLQVLVAISVIDKSVKHQLENSLKLRNGCGHPSSLKVAEHAVSSHIEVLLLNVFIPFAI